MNLNVPHLQLYHSLNEFPSPLGELWIWIFLQDFFFLLVTRVSVPARGIMNLNNARVFGNACVYGLFPSPLGELWIWIPKNAMHPSSIRVSVPARGIMNLNKWKHYWKMHERFLFPSPLGELWIWIPSTYSNILKNAFPSPLGELWIWMCAWWFQALFWIHVSVPARGIMNLNTWTTLTPLRVLLFPSPLGELWIWI